MNADLVTFCNLCVILFVTKSTQKLHIIYTKTTHFPLDNSMRLMYNVLRKSKGVTEMLTKNEIIRRYEVNAFTHNYVFGFPEKRLYYIGFFHDFTRLDEITTVTVESGTGNPAIKFFTNSETRRAVVDECFPLCTVKEFENSFTAWRQAGNKGNRGNYFESLILEKYHGKPGKPGANFNVDCDLYIERIPYQLKAYKASLVTYSLIETLPG